MDDISRFTWVIFLVHKDEAYEAFKVFSKRVQSVKKVFVFHPLDLIMVVNLKIIFLKVFAMNMAFLTISLLL